MEFALTAAQQETQRRAREFAQQELAPIARQADETGEFPAHLVPQLGQLGFLTGPVDPEWGGAGMDYLSFALVYEELGRIDAAFRGFLAVHAGLVSLCLNDWGTAEQKHHYLPRLATGELIGCYCLTEKNSGSDAASLCTRATPDKDGYILEGEKIWITNANIAGLAVVFATLDPEARHRGISAFLVETDRPGFERHPMPGQELGHRSADHARVVLNQCRVPAGSLLGKTGEGFKIAMSALDHGRLGVAAGAVGLGQGCLDACLDFVRRRRQFGKRIGDFQMIQATLADMASALEASRLLVYKAAWMKDQDLPTTRATSIAKLFTTEAALEAASQAVLLHGGRGYSSEYPVERHYRDIKGLQIYEGTSHIQRIIIARDLVGKDLEK